MKNNLNEQANNLKINQLEPEKSALKKSDKLHFLCTIIEAHFDWYKYKIVWSSLGFNLIPKNVHNCWLTIQNIWVTIKVTLIKWNWIISLNINIYIGCLGQYNQSGNNKILPQLLSLLKYSSSTFLTITIIIIITIQIVHHLSTDRIDL